MVTTIFFYSFFCIITWLFPLSFRRRNIAIWTGMMVWGLKKICLVDYQVTGLENIPKDRVGIIMSKHQSTWETFYINYLFNSPAIILKKQLLYVPFFGWGLATIEPIAINRNAKATAMEQIITQGQKCLDDDRWILIFPEGTRIPVGEIGQYRAGGARLATKTHAPILPIAHNAGYFWAKRRFIKRPGTLQVVIGPLIETEGKTADVVLAEVKNWIETTISSLPKPDMNY
jgi:1-acyl-sn-glycerol-3-phosphate acyltransferase